MKNNGFMKFAFPSSPHRERVNVAILLGRIAFAILLAYHGLVKLATFGDLAPEFPNPFGFGGEASLAIVIFVEVVGALFIIPGFITRLVAIPVAIVMLVAYFFVHGASLVEGELSLIYAIVFILLAVTGAGKFSIDHKIHKKFRHSA